MSRTTEGANFRLVDERYNLQTHRRNNHFNLVLGMIKTLRLRPDAPLQWDRSLFDTIEENVSLLGVDDVVRSPPLSKTTEEDETSVPVVQCGVETARYRSE